MYWTLFFFYVYLIMPLLVYFCIISKYCGIEEAPTVAFCFLFFYERPASLLCQSSDLRLLSVHFQFHTTCWDYNLSTAAHDWFQRFRPPFVCLPEVSVLVVVVVITVQKMFRSQSDSITAAVACEPRKEFQCELNAFKRSSTEMPSVCVFSIAPAVPLMPAQL